jgi:hypothetical protein
LESAVIFEYAKIRKIAPPNSQLAFQKYCKEKIRRANVQSQLEIVAKKHALCAPGHLMGADPDKTGPSEGMKERDIVSPSERRVLSGSAPIK